MFLSKDGQLERIEIKELGLFFNRSVDVVSGEVVFVLEKSDGLRLDRKSTRLNSSHLVISYAVFCLKKKKQRCLNVLKIPQ